MTFLIASFVLLLLASEVTEAQRCSDLHENCYWWSLLNFCLHPRHAVSMSSICKESCNLCDSLGREVRPTSTDSCDDQNPSCPTWSQFCKQNGQYWDYMKVHCKKTCNLCPDCDNQNPSCPTWKRYCNESSIYWPYMKKNCKKTCKLCPDGGSGGGSGGGGGGGGGGSGGSGGKKEYVCDFESDFCDWANQPIDDAANWAIGVASGGPSSGAKGSASYAYVDSISSSYNARLILPWELVLPLDKTYIGSMCLHMSYQTGSGSLKVIEKVYPTENNRSPRLIVRATLQGSGTWVSGKVLVQVDDKRQLTLEGIVGNSGRVVIDNIAFVKGRC